MSISDARAILAEATGRSEESIPEGATAGNFPVWDSLAHVRLILALEERVGRSLTSEEVTAIRSIDDVATLLESAVGH